MKTEKVVGHIVQWLLDYLGRSGLKGFAIGVSGGIDSAVTSTLCAKTGKPVLALNMPIHQAKDRSPGHRPILHGLKNTFPPSKALTLN